MASQLIVKGHTLRGEGQSMYGPAAICSCGWRSDPLPSANQRKKAHRAHKERVSSNVVEIGSVKR